MQLTGEGRAALVVRAIATAMSVGVALLASPAFAQESGLSLSFEPSPDHARVATYRLYVGFESRSYRGYIDIGQGEAVGGALRRFPYPAPRPSQSTFLALTARGFDGSESDFSNEIVLEPSTPISSVLYDEGFESFAVDVDPGGVGGPAVGVSTRWVDGEIALGMDAHSGPSPLTYDLLDLGDSVAEYEFLGRLSTESSADIGILLTYDSPGGSRSFSLSWDGAGAIALSGAPADELRCAPAAGATVAQPGLWYEFRLRVTRFQGRTRARGVIWPEGDAWPTAWSFDCWEDQASAPSAATLTLWSTGPGAKYFDDLALIQLEDGALPSGWTSAGTPGAVPPSAPMPFDPQPQPPVDPVPAPPPPPPAPAPDPEPDPAPSPPPAPSPAPAPEPVANGYQGADELQHWWRPGFLVNDIGADFGQAAAIDVMRDAWKIGQVDVRAGWTDQAFVHVDGKAEVLGNLAPQRYGIGDRFSFATWVYVDKYAAGRGQELFDLNATADGVANQRLRLFIDAADRWSVEVTGSPGSRRTLSGPAPATGGQSLRWYHVAVVKDARARLTLYVDGQVAATASSSIPAQTDALRVLRIGAGLGTPAVRPFRGAFASIALWNRALGQAEIESLFNGGDLRRSLALDD